MGVVFYYEGIKERKRNMRFIIRRIISEIKKLMVYRFKNNYL